MHRGSPFPLQYRFQQCRLIISLLERGCNKCGSACIFLKEAQVHLQVGCPVWLPHRAPRKSWHIELPQNDMSAHTLAGRSAVEAVSALTNAVSVLRSLVSAACGISLLETT